MTTASNQLPELPPEHLKEHPQAVRVSTIELFFDLVFVFTITQITHLVEDVHHPLDFLLAFLVLILIWWMYAAYAWLGNALAEQKSLRLILIAAMAGFLVMALAVPTIFGEGGLIFGVAYLFVVVVHMAAFWVKGGPGASRAILAVAPFNLAAAALVIMAGLINTEWDWLLFLAGPILFITTTLFRSYQRFSVNPAYFVERHGLIIILALGESVIAIGTGAADRRLDGQTVLAIVLALLFNATLWWSYFDRDDTRAEESMVAASPVERSRLALLGFGYTHLIMIFGIILVATGLKELVAHSEEFIATAAWLLAAGTATYLVGDLMFRRIMKIGVLITRTAGAVAALALGFVGLWWGGIAELVAAILLMVLIFAIEQLTEQKSVQITTA